VRTVPAYRNMNEVKEKMAPLVLRRKVEDLKDVNLPEVNVSDVFLDLYPAQRNKYDELRRGVLQIMKEQGNEVKYLTALTQIHYGSQICGGLATLGEPDGPNTSVKMDWIIEKLTGELEEEKVVLFANYKNSVRALQERFRQNRIGFETVWGEEPNRDARKRSQDRFWDDPNCKVLIGTQSIEQSLNLQVSRHLVNMDMIMNPKRMEQLAGRIRRDGSAHKHVWVHNLLTTNTQEERYLPLLERESALADFVWDENNELFNALPPMTLMQLITG
jgi:SNF2 family DNA or RNA helicase